MCFISLFAATAQANICAQVFSSPKPPAHFLFQEDREALHNLSVANHLVEQATSQEELIEALYILATQANGVVDNIVDNLLMIDSKNLPAQKESMFQISSANLLRNLAAMTHVNLKILEQVVRIRYVEDLAVLKDKEQKSRDRSSSIGYIEHKREEGTEDSDATVTIGFDLTQNQENIENAETLLEIDPNEPPPLNEIAEQVDRGPFGFIEFNKSEQSESLSAKEKVGFVRFAEPGEESQVLIQIILNMQTGQFLVEKPKNPIGFGNP